jgi:hypothetical protein
MNIYDSNRPQVRAMALGALLTLIPVSQMAPLPNKALSTNTPHMPLMGSVVGLQVPTSYLQYGGPYGYAPVSTLLAGVVNGDSLTLDGKAFVAGTDFTVGANDAETATNLAAAINTEYKLKPGAWFAINAGGMLFDATLTGTGFLSGNADIEVSLDGVTPHSLGTSGAPLFSLTDSTASDFSKAEVAVYPFIRANPKALTGTNARLQVNMAVTDIM